MWMKNKFCCCKPIKICVLLCYCSKIDMQDNQILGEIDTLSSVNSKNIYFASVLQAGV